MSTASLLFGPREEAGARRETVPAVEARAWWQAAWPRLSLVSEGVLALYQQPSSSTCPQCGLVGSSIHNFPFSLVVGRRGADGEWCGHCRLARSSSEGEAPAVRNRGELGCEDIAPLLGKAFGSSFCFFGYFGSFSTSPVACLAVS